MKMAQPNVAREPSMEEILASIRRIIESNEPQAEAGPGHPLQPAYTDAPGYADDDVEDIDIVAEMAANDRGAPPPAPEAVPAARPFAQPLAQSVSQPLEREMPAERSLSLADVAARVREASARQFDNGTVRLQPATAAPSAMAEPVTPAPVKPAPVAPVPASPALASSAPDLPQVQPERRDLPFRPQSAAMGAAELRPSHPVAPSTSQSPAPSPALSPTAAALPARVEAATTLLSREAGAQVARSFGELADVFNGVEKPSLEEMAQDMLRPMLQEWLDDNLPTLVEKLVREEIERVARGPRR